MKLFVATALSLFAVSCAGDQNSELSASDLNEGVSLTIETCDESTSKMTEDQRYMHEFLDAAAPYFYDNIVYIMSSSEFPDPTAMTENMRAILKNHADSNEDYAAVFVPTKINGFSGKLPSDLNEVRFYKSDDVNRALETADKVSAATGMGVLVRDMSCGKKEDSNILEVWLQPKK